MTSELADGLGDHGLERPRREGHLVRVWRGQIERSDLSRLFGRSRRQDILWWSLR